MRGEDQIYNVPVLGIPGSPPHARGRRSALASDEFWDGITPACAGKTNNASLGLTNNADHPRMRGEDTPPFIAYVDEAGSPPHARGRPFSSDSVMCGAWITPACAGKTNDLNGSHADS